MNRHPAFKGTSKRAVADIYIPDSTSLTTSDQRRLMRLGLTKHQAIGLLRDGVIGAPGCLVGLRSALVGVKRT